MSAPKVMHVEDDPDIREIALIALETVGGLEVAQCSSGEEALRRVRDLQPDLFLLDVMMPGMSGEETLLELRKIECFADTPAVFMTAKAQPLEVKRLLGLGALEVVVKPFDPMTLGETLINIWKLARS